jgi:putative DNA primase/helicase
MRPRRRDVPASSGAAVERGAPTALPVRVEGIPSALTERRQWVAWRWEWDADRHEWTKVPVNAQTGGRASVTNPAHWVAFGDALAYADVHGLPGIGFVVTRDDPFTGIDLDKCRDPMTGALALWATEIVDEFASYTEVTPTGTGVRIWIVGTVVGLVAEGRSGCRTTKPPKIEVYSADRYFTVTGHPLDGDGE